MRRGLGVVVVVLVALSVAQPASAHEAREFKACTVHMRGMCIARGATFEWGDTVPVKGSVKPVHAGYRARPLRQRPHSVVWRIVATVRVSDSGRMRFHWPTVYEDAVQEAPYLFKFKIPGHGTSNKTEAWVIFGE